MKEHCSQLIENPGPPKNVTFCQTPPTERIAARGANGVYYYVGLPMCAEHAESYKNFYAKDLHAIRIRETLNLLRVASGATTPWQAYMFAVGLANSYYIPPQVERALEILKRVEGRRMRREGH